MLVQLSIDLKKCYEKIFECCWYVYKLSLDVCWFHWQKSFYDLDTTCPGINILSVYSKLIFTVFVRHSLPPWSCWRWFNKTFSWTIYFPWSTLYQHDFIGISSLSFWVDKRLLEICSWFKFQPQTVSEFFWIEKGVSAVTLKRVRVDDSFFSWVTKF